MSNNASRAVLYWLAYVAIEREGTPLGVRAAALYARLTDEQV